MTPTEKLLQRQDEIIDQIRVIEPDFYYVESCYGRTTLKSIKATIQRLEQYLAVFSGCFTLYNSYNNTRIRSLYSRKAFGR